MTRDARTLRLGPIASSGALALASAVAFGATTPLVQHFGRGVGPFSTAALLYAGAALFSTVSGGRGREVSLSLRDAPRVAAVATLGAVVAPVAFAWGLQHTSGVTASLALSLEALFTALLARALWAEPIGVRVGIALAAMTGGGVLLVAGGRAFSLEAGWGTIAVVLATLAWAGDNAVGRPLADRDPAHVVRVKGALGAGVSAGLALAWREPWPATSAAFGIAACGAAGFGASLWLYLRAQRGIGAARTSSIFAIAPFVGAAIAWAMGERAAGVSTWFAGALCALGLWLHLTEAHGHPHAHDALEHEHPHGHDEGHHVHHHDVYPDGEHSHCHRHEATVHSHPHGLDVHHRHRH
jgi:drug/metabolite transporter (DMT)-like permease